jgi:predicted DNA-binding protein
MTNNMQINTRLSKTLYNDLKRYAQENDRTMGYLIRQFIANGLKKTAPIKNTKKRLDN